MHFLWYSLKVPIPPGHPLLRCGKERGALAQLGARLNGIQKVVGSNPICSIEKVRGCGLFSFSFCISCCITPSKYS